MKIKNVLILINSILILSIIGFLFLNENKEKTVFIDNYKLFSQFNMTKELSTKNDEKYKPVLEHYDSLVKTISNLEAQLKLKKRITNKDKEKYAELRREVSIQEDKIRQIRIDVKDDINKKVWNRLNAYINEYGKLNEVDLILGAQGEGNIMYGSKSRDITDEFIEFANNKYEGN